MRSVQRWVRVFSALWVVAAASFVAGPTHAGQKQNLSVVISAANKSISGYLGSVRNSGDNVQYLQITVTDGIMSVNAMTVAGNSASCVSTNATLINLALHVPSDANVIVRWDASGSCSSLLFTNDSTAPAKSQ